MLSQSAVLKFRPFPMFIFWNIYLKMLSQTEFLFKAFWSPWCDRMQFPSALTLLIIPDWKCHTVYDLCTYSVPYMNKGKVVCNENTYILGTADDDRVDNINKCIEYCFIDAQVKLRVGDPSAAGCNLLH